MVFSYFDRTKADFGVTSAHGIAQLLLNANLPDDFIGRIEKKLPTMYLGEYIYAMRFVITRVRESRDFE